jgi:flavorubredoxin
MRKAEQQAWKQVPEMMDAFDTWLEDQAEKAKKVVIATDDSIAKKKEVVIATDDSIAKKKEVAIREDALLAQKQFLIDIASVHSQTDPRIPAMKVELSPGGRFHILTSDKIL